MVAGSSQLLLRPNDSAVDSFCQCEISTSQSPPGIWDRATPRLPARHRFLLATSGTKRIRLHRPAVENAQLRGELLAEYFRGFATDNGVGFPREFGSGGFAGANRPHRFVSDDQFSGLLGRDGVEGADALRRSTSSVSPASRSSNTSPTQQIGVSPASSAVLRRRSRCHRFRRNTGGARSGQ